MNNEDFVICPICNKSFKQITMTHLKVHNYTNKEDFINEYPNTQLVSKSYYEFNHKLRHDILVKRNKSENQRRIASEHCKRLNQDSDRQRAKQKKMFSNPANRVKQIESTRKMLKERFLDPNYILNHITYGKRIPYKINDNFTLTLRSFMECRFTKFLLLNNIDFEYEKLSFSYEYEGKIHQYIPDFYLPKYNLIIEVKPLKRQTDSLVILKKNSVPSTYNYMFVSSEDLDNYNDLLNKIIRPTC